MSGDRERRGGERDRDVAYESALEPRQQFAPRTPTQEAEDRAHQERLGAESLQLEVEQLGEVPAAQWADRKQSIERRLERLKATLGTSAGATSERADRDRGATVAAVMAVEAALARAAQPRVPAVAGEDELLPAVTSKTIDKGELLEWFAGLPASDRAAVWRRYERASTGQRDPKRPDDFARALANYVAAVRIRDDLQHLVHMSAHQIAGWRKRRDGGAKRHGEHREAAQDDRERAAVGEAAEPKAAAPKAADHGGAGAVASPVPDGSAGLVGAAHAVSLAAGRAHVALAGSRPPDAELAGLRGSLESLADALHGHAGARSRTDEQALRTAFGDAGSIAEQLATRHGPRNPAEVELLKYLAFAQRQAGAAETSTAARRSPEELRTTATASASMLQHARAATAQSSAPPSDPVLHELDRAIATTQGWTETLTDGEPSSARRLSRAVMDQHVFLAKAHGELNEVLGRRVTRSTASVLEAYVHALARSVEREDQAEAALERARRLARRQALDLVDDALDRARDTNAELAGTDRAAANRARRDQQQLADRKDQLEARIARGGRVPGAALDDLVIDAREQAFTNRIRSIDGQSHQLAVALDSMDDGLVGWLANGDNTALPRLVSDLHGLGRVAREIRNRYRDRLAGFATSHGDEPNRDTPAWIAERGAAIDQAEDRLSGWLATGHFDESLQHAHDMIESAQIRSLIVNIGLQIGIAIVAGAAGRMVARGMQGMMEARVGGEIVSAVNLAPVAAASVATDLAITSLGQKGLGGDKSSLITIGTVNLSSIMVLGRLQAHFKGLDELMRDSAKVSIVWGKAASLGGRAALQGVSITEEMVLGAAVNYAVRKAEGAQVASPTDDDATTWLLQGASIAVGRGIANRVHALQQTMAARGDSSSPAIRGLLDKAAAVEPLAAAAEATGSPEAGRALVAPARELLAAEAALAEDASIHASHGPVRQESPESPGPTTSNHAPASMTAPVHETRSAPGPAAIVDGPATPLEAPPASAVSPSATAGHTAFERQGTLESIDNVTGIAKGVQYEKAMEQLKDWYEVEQPIDAQKVTLTSGQASDGPYGWAYGHDSRRFKHGAIHVEFRVFLDPASPRIRPSHLAKLKASVIAGVDRYFNFRESGGFERLHVEVVFVDSPSAAHLRVHVHPRDGRAFSNKWYVDGDPTTHAHELGHAVFGLKDEYVDPSVPGRTHSADSDVSHDGSLMGNYWTIGAGGKPSVAPGTTLHQRHLDWIAKQMPPAGPRAAGGQVPRATHHPRRLNTSETIWLAPTQT